MIYPEERKLFTVKDVSRACGVSRTTLIRMEESGFLTPYRIDPDSGHRYYDADNIASIGQYLLLSEFGISRKEIADIYLQKEDMTEFLSKQRKKLNRLMRLIDELELRHDNTRTFSCSYIDLPEMTCFCKAMKSSSPNEMATEAYENYGDCVQSGFRILGTEPLFLVLDKTAQAGFFSDVMQGTTGCIPVDAPVESDPRLKLFPAVHAFSMIAYGSYDIIPKMFERFIQEVKTRGLTASGQLRFIALVAPYVGSHIKTDDFCFELALPVKV